MRSGLLSELENIGYEIFLNGDNLHLRYRKPGVPPESVCTLIAELRESKEEVISLLKMADHLSSAEKIDYGPNRKPQWPSKIEELIAGFKRLDRPVAPFYLELHRWIIDPEKFFQALDRDIDQGPMGPRARMGTLQSDIRKMKIYFH